MKPKDPEKITVPILTFDGATRKQFNLSAAAAVIQLPNNKIYSVDKAFPSSSSTRAEYEALIIGLEKAKELKISHIEIRGDSKSIIDKILKKSNSNAKFLILNEKITKLLSCFDEYSLTWIPRRENRLANKKARSCLKNNLPPSND